MLLAWLGALGYKNHTRLADVAASDERLRLTSGAVRAFSVTQRLKSSRSLDIIDGDQNFPFAAKQLQKHRDAAFCFLLE